MAKLKDIAEKSGLSVPTVIQVLGNRGHLYRKETRQRVLKAATELGYKPNASAKAMRSGRFGGIGLLLSTLRSRSDLSIDLLEGIQQVLSEHDLTLSLASLPDQKLASGTYLPKILRELAVDGLIVNYTHFIPPDMLKLITANSIPAIWVNTKRSTDCVYMNDQQGAQFATEAVLQRGHRRIAFIDLQSDRSQSNLHYSVHDRYAGYETAMKAAGLQPRAIWHNRALNPAERTAIAMELLKSEDRPTAMVCYSAWMDTMPLMIAAREYSLSIPKDISLITFSSWTFNAWGQPVATMLLPIADMGTTACNMLLEAINASSQKRRPSKVLELKLSEGTTLAPVAIR